MKKFSLLATFTTIVVGAISIGGSFAAGVASGVNQIDTIKQDQKLTAIAAQRTQVQLDEVSRQRQDDQREWRGWREKMDTQAAETRTDVLWIKRALQRAGMSNE